MDVTPTTMAATFKLVNCKMFSLGNGQKNLTMGGRHSDCLKYGSSAGVYDMAKCGRVFTTGCGRYILLVQNKTNTSVLFFP